MRIGLQTWGSDGDIRPFIALAGGLSAAGHNVCLVVTSVDGKNYQRYADELKFKIIHTSSAVGVDADEFKQAAGALIQESNTVRELRLLFDHFFEPVVNEMYAAAQNLGRNSDVIIRHFMHYPALVASRKFLVPDISVMFTHSLVPTSYRSPGNLPDFGRNLNKLWWWLANAVINKHIKHYSDKLFLSENLILPKDVLRTTWSSRYLNLIAVSSVFCAGFKDWSEHHYVSGYLAMPTQKEQAPLAEELKNFLQQGDPPVYITFGSLLPHEPVLRRKTINLFLKAIKKAKARAIIQVFAEDIPELKFSQQIFYLAFSPHELIFPYCSVVVHHGGAGTTHSATKAGVPSIVIEHLGDQHFWGRELYRLGISPKPLHRRTLTADDLANSVRAVQDSPAMKKCAEEVGATMQQEDGVAMAVARINSFLENMRKK